jgi:predicted  nucleic acid-binding Zn-ribbon protein
MESNKEVSEEVKVKSLQECKDQVAENHGAAYWNVAMYNTSTELLQIYDDVAELYASQFKSETTSLREENDNLRKIIHDSGNEYQARMDQQLQSIMKDANVKINELQSELERVTKENEELKAKIK